MNTPANLVQHNSRFLRHEPCEKCGSRDNKGVWEDGHTYCFGCRDYKPSERTLQIMPQVDATNLTWLGQMDENIPLTAISWLYQYGITVQEIKQYKLKFHQGRELLIFPLGKPTPLTYAGRYFGHNPAYAKAITFGRRDHGHWFGDREADTCCFVEDCVSAIKVGRHIPCLPILGSEITLNQLHTASNNFKRVLVWLDFDMASKAVKTASMGSMYYPANFIPVLTEKDPKAYPDPELKSILAEFIPELVA
jgi:hypothetical protein